MSSPRRIDPNEEVPVSRDIDRERRERRPSPKPRRLPPGEIIDDSGMFRKRSPSPVSRRRLEDEKKRVPPKYRDKESGRATGLDVDEIKKRDRIEREKERIKKEKEKKRKIKDRRARWARLRRRRKALRRARRRRRMRRRRRGMMIRGRRRRRSGRMLRRR